MTSSRLERCLSVARALGVLHLIVAIGALLTGFGAYAQWLGEDDKSGFAGFAFLVVLPCLSLGAPVLVLAVACLRGVPTTAFGALGVLGLCELAVALTWSGVVLVTWDEVTGETVVAMVLAIAAGAAPCVVAAVGLLAAERDHVARLVWLTRVLVGVHAAVGAAVALLVGPIALGLTGDGFYAAYLVPVVPALLPVAALAVVLRAVEPRQVHACGLALASTAMLTSAVCVGLAGLGAGLVVLVPAVVLGVASYDGVRSVRLTPVAH